MRSPKLRTYTQAQARRDLPSRKKFDNKTHGGRALVIAGHPGFLGAGVLTATAAARAGAGYTHLVTRLEKYSFQKNPDFLTSELKGLRLQDQTFDSVGIGPGLGTDAKVHRLIGQLIRIDATRVVLDADALTVLSMKKKFDLPTDWILTPHMGELARLLGITSKAAKSMDPLELALRGQKKYGCIILLKGAETLITDGERHLIVKSGTRGLAKAGTGDVLTGMIVGLMAQGLPPLQAAALGAYVHGFASQLWLRQGKDHLSLLASDLLGLIPFALTAIRGGK